MVVDVLNRRTTTRGLPIALAVTAMLTPTPTVRAQRIDESKAIKVRAAYLYNFAKFIQWPEDSLGDAKQPFVIGVLGHDPFGQHLDATVRAKKIAHHPVKIRRLHWNNSGDRATLKNCHVLYISNSERYRLKEISAALKDQPVLLVADIPRFASDGGMIGFVFENQRIIFEINPKALKQARLKASARLLKLAKIVRPEVRRK